jgi:hypothetical protein
VAIAGAGRGLRAADALDSVEHKRLGTLGAVCAGAAIHGDVHLDGLTPASAHGSAFVEQGAGPLAEVRDKDHKSQGTADFDCPICALIQLASTSAPSVAPPLPIPAMVGGLALETPDELGFASSPIFAFQARGPPSV